MAVPSCYGCLVPGAWLKLVEQEVEFLILWTDLPGAVQILFLHVWDFQLVFPISEQFWRVLVLDLLVAETLFKNV